MPMKASLSERIKAFNTGTMNVSKRVLTKRELEEKKKQEDERQAAKVFEDFVASFDEKDPTPKAAFVRGSIINADATGVKEIKHEKEGLLYQPQPKKPSTSNSSQSRKNLDEIKREIEKRMNSESISKKKKEDSKKKSNLEAFKEELKQMHEAREEHGKIKQQIRSIEEKVREKAVPLTAAEQKILALKTQLAASEEMANTDVTDPNSTNCYVSNIHCDLLEEHLCKLFGKYGPLASVKIMYPREEDNKPPHPHRGRANCGFVAFMCRKDAERAMANLNGIEYKGLVMGVAWGRSVPIPPQPIYIPKRLRKMLMPPPPTKQPFNALHPDMRQLSSVEDSDEAKALWEKNLEESCVKVCVPTDRTLLNLIHRMVEFVVREGPMFEAVIMNKEMNNPMFRFLFDNQSPAHLYYRWKLFSILQGDQAHIWRTEPFRMFKNGPIWKPPPYNVFQQGMPSDDETDEEDDLGMLASRHFIKPKDKSPSRHDRKRKHSGSKSPKRGLLSDGNKERFDDILNDLTGSRDVVGDAMLFCLDHADCAEQIVRIVVDKIQYTNQTTKRLAYLYLINDLLHNSAAKVVNAASYRKHIEPNLRRVFGVMHESYTSLESRFKQEHFKQKVMSCFRAWEQWAIYPEFHLIKLQNIFLGLEKFHCLDGLPDDDSDQEAVDGAPLGEGDSADLDGAPLADEDIDLDVLQKNEELDGIPLSKDGEMMAEDEEEEERRRELPPAVNEASNHSKAEDEDIDGEPMNPKLKPTKWEEVEPGRLAAEAMTISKWDVPESDDDESGAVSRSARSTAADDDDIDGVPLDGEDSSPTLVNRSPPPPKEDSSHETTASLILDGLNLTEAEKRQKLREIEVKVMKFQDELESSKKSKKSNNAKLLHNYRIKLANKEKEKLAKRKLSDTETVSSDDQSPKKNGSKSKRLGSRSSHRSPSRSSGSSSSIDGSSSRKRGLSPAAASDDDSLSSSRKSKRSKSSKKSRNSSPVSRRRDRSSKSRSPQAGGRSRRSRSGSPHRSTKSAKKNKR